jgi:Fe-S-cluster containining protein
VDGVVAILTLNSQATSVIAVSMAKKQYSFNCKRCASLCCSLGGPVITKKEANSIQNTGHSTCDFLEPLNSDVNCPSLVVGGLKTRSDGSCVFLERDQTKNSSTCGIYPVRPALCRLYPFTFQRSGPDKVALKIIPCCLGLNISEGELVTEKFISENVVEPLLEAMRVLHNDGKF